MVEVLFTCRKTVCMYSFFHSGFQGKKEMALEGHHCIFVEFLSKISRKFLTRGAILQSKEKKKKNLQN